MRRKSVATDVLISVLCPDESWKESSEAVSPIRSLYWMRLTNLQKITAETLPVPFWRFLILNRTALTVDHYMNVPYDLSNAIFVCTANSLDTIPEPLLNRMEVINFSGYTAVEKYQIARRHLPKALDAMELKMHWKVTDGAIRRLLMNTQWEAGVRDLKKLIDTLCRTAAVNLLKMREQH